MMEKQKFVLEMAKDICRQKLNCNDVCNPISACDALKYAERAYEEGYRKQSEGEWIMKPHTITHGNMTMSGTYPTCNLCGYAEIGMSKYTAYCANCGARMKGGAE